MSNIILRPWRREDAQQLAAIANNRNIWLNVRDRFPNPYTVMDALQWISKESIAQPVTNFAIVHNEKVVGTAGIILKEDVYRKSIEIGYIIGEPYWGKGFATETVRLLTDHAFNHFGVVRVFAEVFEHNKASMRVLQKNGFYLESIRRKAAIKNGVLLDDYVWVKLAE